MAKVFVFFVLALLGPAAFAGYQGSTSCYATLGEAVTKVAYKFTGQCATGSCRILSYVPVSGQAQVILPSGSIQSFTVMPCASDPVPLDAGLEPTPFYASDSGTVSACGSTVSGSGGVTGGSVGSAVLSGWSMSAEEGALLGVAITGLFALAATWRIIQPRDHYDGE